MSELSATGLLAWLYCASARRRISRSPSSVPPSPLVPPPNGDSIPPLVARLHRGVPSVIRGI